MFFRKAATVLATLLVLAGAAWAQQGQPFQVLNPPQPTEAGKIEVTEFFWYGCPHCDTLESEVNAYIKRAPGDVVVKRVPAIANPQWEEAGRIYYTLEAMGLLEKLHSKVFDAFHRENQNLANRRIREEWLQKNGVDVAKYNEMEKSFSVATKLGRARQMTMNYKVDGVPRVFVNGKYWTAAELAGGGSRVFGVVDQLVNMARRESGAAAPTAAAPAPASKK